MSVADQLVIRGWTQVKVRDEYTGKVCLFGAAMLELGVPEDQLTNHFQDWWMERRFAREVLDSVVPMAMPVTNWNDTPGRTFDEVLRVAKRADEVFDAIRELSSGSSSVNDDSDIGRDA